MTTATPDFNPELDDEPLTDEEPDAGEYLPEPEYSEEQEKEPGEVPEQDAQIHAFAARSTAQSPRDWRGALEWASGQIVDRDRSWFGLCQMFCRSSYAIGGGFGSAFDQWNGLPAHAKFPGNDPDDAPIGAMLFSKGSSPFGHIMIAARPFANGTRAAISTDAKRAGWPDRVGRRALLASWGHDYLGYGTNMNGVDLRYRMPIVAKPEDAEPYLAIAVARVSLGRGIDRLRVARETAKGEKDWKDRDRIQESIDLARKLDGHLEAQYKNLRHS